MTERILPGIGLTGYWDQGAPWKVGGDQNWLKSSVLTQLAVESATMSLPASPLNGVIYIVPAADTNANQVAARDNGAWVFMPPQEGWTAYVRDTGVLMNYDGATWVPATTPLAAPGGAAQIGSTAGNVQSDINARPTSAGLAAAAGAAAVGSQAANIAAVAQTVADKIFIRKDLFDFIPVSERAAITAGTSTYDATAKVVAAFAWASGFMRDGAVASFKLPGACLTINPGKYQLDTLAATIPVLSNLLCEGAEFVLPAGFATEVFRVGLDAPGVNLSAAKIELPNVSKVHVDVDPVAGSVGVRLCNLNASDVTMGRTTHMETAWKFGGIGEGTVYNRIKLGQSIYCKKMLDLSPGSGGWCNINVFVGGNLAQSPGFAGGGVRRTGWRHLVMDGRSPATSVVGNVFLGTSFEGNTSEYMFDLQNAYGNNWVNCYHETGAPSEAVTVSGDTITQTAHGKVVGDAMVFNASVAPTGMQLGSTYYVVAVPTADTMKISLNKAGTAVTFGSAGTSVVYKLCMRLLFAQTASENNYNNRLFDTFMPASIALDVIETGVASNNGETRAERDFKSVSDAADMPPWRGQNKSGTATRRPIWAAYPTTAHPILQPDLWTCAISDRGLFFKTAGAETGLVSVVGGVLKYSANAGAAFEISSCTRSPSSVTVTALSVPANGEATAVLTLTGAAAFDYVTANPTADLPAGISIKNVWASAANTIRIGFTNYTASPISLTASFWLKADRRFF